MARGSSSRKFAIGVLVILQAVPGVVRAGDGLMHPLAAGIVYPGLNGAPVLNPAGLVNEDSIIARGSFAPPIFGSSSTGYGADLGASFQQVGFGAGIGTTSVSGGGGSNPFSWDVGAAFAADRVSLGATLSSTAGGTGTTGTGNPFNLSLGFLYGAPNTVTWGASLANLNNTGGQLTLGVGYSERRNYNLEVNLLLPQFSQLFSVFTYGLTVAAAAYAGIFGLSFSATSTFSFGGNGAKPSFFLSQGVSLMIRPFKSSYFSFSFQNGAFPSQYVGITASGMAPVVSLNTVF